MEVTRIMKKLVIFGYGIDGVKFYRKLMNEKEYEIIGFADNSPYKQNNFVGNLKIYSMQELIDLATIERFSVVIAAKKWFVIGEELEKYHINIEGIYEEGKIAKYDRMCFERLDLSKNITLYAGDIYDDVHMSDNDLYALSLNKADSKHILHDITMKYPLPDNSIFSYQAEDVLEHIEFSKLTDCINEIYRILKKGGLFRICLPDYNSPYLRCISMKDRYGKLLFDPTGGGKYHENGVSKGGHVWFPDYLNVKSLLEGTKFKDINFLCYHTESGQLIRKEIDFAKGYIKRVPKENENNKVTYSIVVDCYK